MPLHASPMGRKAARAAGPLPNTEALSERLVRLPFWLGLEEHQARVAERIVEAAMRAGA